MFFLHSEKVLVQTESLACWSMHAPVHSVTGKTHLTYPTFKSCWTASHHSAPKITCSWDIMNVGCEWGGRERLPHWLHISPLFTHMLHCSIRLHLQNISSKIKLLAIIRGDRGALNQAYGPSNHGILWETYFAHSLTAYWSLNVSWVAKLSPLRTIELWYTVHCALGHHEKYNHNGLKMCYFRQKGARKAWLNWQSLSETFENESLEIPWAHSPLIFSLFSWAKYGFEGVLTFS